MNYLNINFTSVILISIISFLLERFWFGVIFKKKIAEMLNTVTDKPEEKISSLNNHIFSVILIFIFQYVLAIIINLSGAHNLPGGLLIAFLCWLGFTASTSYIISISENKPIILWRINNVYNLWRGG